MKKVTLTLMVITIGLLLSLPAFAFGPGRGDGPGDKAGYCRDAAWKKLDLTDDQKTKIEKMQIALRKEIQPLRDKHFDKSVELRRLWLKADLDKEKIIAVQKEVRALRDEMQDKVTASLVEMSKVLTPEQREKLENSRFGKRGIGFGPRGGMRGHHGDGRGMGMCN